MLQKTLIFLFLITTSYAQNNFKIKLFLENGLKKEQFKFLYHNGKKLINTDVVERNNEIILSGKYKNKITYLQINQPIDNGYVRRRFLINKKSAEMHLFGIDSLVLKNLTSITNFERNFYAVVYKEKAILNDIYSSLAQHPESDSLKAKVSAANSIIIEKQLKYIEQLQNKHISLIFLNDIIEFLHHIDSENIKETFQLLPKSIKNSSEGKELLANINMKRLRATNEPKIGKSPPNINTKDIDGNRINLEELKGKYVLLVFWATWCKPCVKEIPALRAIRNQYNPSSLEMISIAWNDDKTKISNYVKAKSMYWKHIVGDEKIIGDYYIYGIPEVVLIDSNGKIVYIKLTDDLSELEKLLKEKIK